MGREVKRVALDFNWPLELQWKGYISPYSSQKCSVCDGSGQNPATKKIADDWYDFARTGARWNDKITQDEVQALVDGGRLMDWTHTWAAGEGWKQKDPPYVPTAEEVNAANERPGMRGHDAINRWICVKARAQRLGVYGHCHVCEGEGAIWFNDKIKELSEAWYESERYGPPEGDGWQVWETVSEGSPVTPVLPTREALIDYLVAHGDAWDQKRGEGGWKRESAEAFVKAEYAMSLVMETSADGVSIRAPRDTRDAA